MRNLFIREPRFAAGARTFQCKDKIGRCVFLEGNFYRVVAEIIAGALRKVSLTKAICLLLSSQKGLRRTPDRPPEER
jgi:hypothetical protein